MSYLIVRDFESQYRSFQPPEKRTLFYAHPGKRKPLKVYWGMGRETPDLYDDIKEDLCPEQEALLEKIEGNVCPESLEEALLYKDMYEDGENTQLLWVSEEAVCPEEGRLLGYDVGLLPEEEPFSALSDLFFFPLWQGADLTGHEFEEEFEKLNRYGLFSNPEDARGFLEKYSQCFSQVDLKVLKITLIR